MLSFINQNCPEKSIFNCIFTGDVSLLNKFASSLHYGTAWPFDASENHLSEEWVFINILSKIRKYSLFSLQPFLIRTKMVN